MKIFIVVKVPRGNAERRELADLTADIVRQARHVPFVATDEIARRTLTDPKDFMPFARQNAENSGLMIVLYHPELRGGLIEIGIAYANRIPIWLCHKSGEIISSSAFGCADLAVEYASLVELQRNLSANLSQHFPNP